MALHPVGPLPASVYWRRRIVLLCALAAVGLLVRSCTSDDAPARRSSSPTSTPSPHVTATPSKAPVAAAGALCTDAALALTATTDAETYAVGAAPKLTLTVKNRSTTACRRDIGSGAVELLVHSGDDRVWSSDDCNDAKAKELVTLAAGASKTVKLSWSGRRSAPRCTGSRAEVKAGTYRLTARVGTLRAQGAVFRFHD